MKQEETQPKHKMRGPGKEGSRTPGRKRGEEDSVQPWARGQHREGGWEGGRGEGGNTAQPWLLRPQRPLPTALLRTLSNLPQPHSSFKPPHLLPHPQPQTPMGLHTLPLVNRGLHLDRVAENSEWGQGMHLLCAPSSPEPEGCSCLQLPSPGFRVTHRGVKSGPESGGEGQQKENGGCMEHRWGER